MDRLALAVLALALIGCPARTMNPGAGAAPAIPVHELYSGGGAVAGRGEGLIVVHSAAAWQRLAPSLQGERSDWGSFPIDFSRSVVLVVQAPPGGDAAHLFHVTSLTSSGTELVVHVELRAIPGRGPGPSGPTTWSAIPVMNPSLVIAEAPTQSFQGVQVRLDLPGSGPTATTVAHEQ